MVPIIIACLVVATGAVVPLNQKAKYPVTRVKKINSFTDKGHFDRVDRAFPPSSEEVIQERINQQLAQEAAANLRQLAQTEKK